MAERWSQIEAAWILSPAGVAGPLLAQPARRFVTVALGVIMADSQIDPAKVRDILAQPGLWRHWITVDPDAALPPAVDTAKPAGTLPAARQPKNTRLKQLTAAEVEALPPPSRMMYDQLGGMPDWWQPGGGVHGMLQLPGEA